MPSPAQHSPDEERVVADTIRPHLLVTRMDRQVAREVLAALAAAEREELSLATERDEWRDRAQKAERRLAETQDRIERLIPPQREGEDG